MSVFKFLGQLLKVLLPFLMSAAEKAFKKLPKEKQDQIIKISKMVEIIKQMKGKPIDDVIWYVTEIGIFEDDFKNYISHYCLEKGLPANDFESMVKDIWNDADKRTETGLKSLWSGISNIVSSTVAEIDWELLLMGVGEFVYRSFVKGKIKI